jgi:hypothetical protein
VTLRIYAHVMSAEDGERERLRALVGQVAGVGTGAQSVPVDWAPMGTSAEPEDILAAGSEAA